MTGILEPKAEKLQKDRQNYLSGNFMVHTFDQTSLERSNQEGCNGGFMEHA